MQVKGRDTLLVALCAVLLVTLSIIVLRSQGDDAQKKATADAAQSTSAYSGSSPASESSSSAAASSSAKSKKDKKKDPTDPNFEVTKLAPGEVPPQFIIFSFDGAGSTQKWASFSLSLIHI